MQENNNSLLVIILAVLFGSASGFVADLVSKAYLTESYIPISGQLNFEAVNQSKRWGIKDGSRLVVEQNDRAEAAIISSQDSLVGIFKKNPSSKTVTAGAGFNLDDYLRIGQEVAQGFIITSDGWIVTNTKLDDANDYVVVSSDKTVYEIDKFLADRATSFYFLHVNAKDFSVKKFADAQNIRNGQVALSINWGGESVLTSIMNKSDKLPGTVRSSDVFFQKITTVNDVKGLVLFNLAGEVIAFIDKSGKIEPINHFHTAFNSLLKNQVVKRPSLGVRYIDLADLVSTSGTKGREEAGAVIAKDDKGTAVVSGGAAQLGGLKENDIILFVDNIEVSKENNLTKVLQNFKAGDQVEIIYSRNAEKKEVEVKLGEIK